MGSTKCDVVVDSSDPASVFDTTALLPTSSSSVSEEKPPENHKTDSSHFSNVTGEEEKLHPDGVSAPKLVKVVSLKDSNLPCEEIQQENHITDASPLKNNNGNLAGTNSDVVIDSSDPASIPDATALLPTSSSDVGNSVVSEEDDFDDFSLDSNQTNRSVEEPKQKECVKHANDELGDPEITESSENNSSDIATAAQSKDSNSMYAEDAGVNELNESGDGPLSATEYDEITKNVEKEDNSANTKSQSFTTADEQSSSANTLMNMNLSGNHEDNQVGAEHILNNAGAATAGDANRKDDANVLIKRELETEDEVNISNSENGQTGITTGTKRPREDDDSPDHSQVSSKRLLEKDEIVKDSSITTDSKHDCLDGSSGKETPILKGATEEDEFQVFVNSSNSEDEGSDNDDREDIKNEIKTVDNDDREDIKNEIKTVEVMQNKNVGSIAKAFNIPSLSKRKTDYDRSTLDMLLGHKPSEASSEPKIKKTYYVCFACGTSFADQNLFQDHKQVHVVQAKYDEMAGRPSELQSCVVCYESFAFQEHYIYHVATESFGCQPSCFVGRSSNKSNTTDNSKKEDGTFCCLICSTSFLNLYEFLKHTLTHQRTHQSKPSMNTEPCTSVDSYNRCSPMFSCEFCLMTYPTSASLKLHTRTLHFTPHICPYCCTSFRSFEEILYHCFLDHPAMKLSCDLCGHPFVTQAQMLHHRIRHVWEAFPEEDLYMFECPTCKRRIRDKESYAIHMEIHRTSASVSAARSSHLHEQSDMQKIINPWMPSVSLLDGGFECPLCKEKLQNAQEYLEHMEIHKKSSFNGGQKEIEKLLNPWMPALGNVSGANATNGQFLPPPMPLIGNHPLNEYYRDIRGSASNQQHNSFPSPSVPNSQPSQVGISLLYSVFFKVLDRSLMIG